MISTSTGFKTAIRSSSRRIRAKLIFSDKIIEEVDLIEIDSYLTDEEDFIIGTANMDVAKVEISDDLLNPIFYDFNDKEAEIQLGVTLSDSLVEYHSLGRYTVEKSDRKNSKIYLDLVDRMHKADTDYISNLSYPATLSQIVTSAAAQVGLVLASSTFLNSDHIVTEEPVYEGITCRQVFAYIAEIAGGYARIDRSGQLWIKTLGSLSSGNITGDHYIDWKKAESAPGTIDKLIIKNGEESASSGTGDNIYTIVDNIFVSNPGRVVDNIFLSISTVNYKAGELNWIGDFSLDVGDRVTVDGEDTYILNRKLKYTGGLRETVKIPGKSNIEKNSTGKPNTNLEIRDIKTKIKIISGEISQVIENTVARTEWQQTVDGFNITVSSIEEDIQNIELTPGPPGYTPIKGTDYFDGQDGQDGSSSYLWVRYSQNSNGSGMTTNPTDAKYIGTATTTTPSVPAYTSFSWSLIKGTDGLPGEDGIDGKTSYLHIKYSNDGGVTFTANGGETVGEWIGTYVDFAQADSTSVSVYTWNKVKGEKGDTGEQGIRGIQGPDGTQGIQGPVGANGLTSYTHIAYATNSTGTTGFSTSDPVNKTYIGMYTDFTEADSSNPAVYQWSLIKGSDGTQGIQGPTGANGLTSYLHIAYANNSTGTTGFSTTVSTAKTYIGQYTDFNSADSSNPALYSWTLIKGDQGIQGVAGPIGVQGIQGVNGNQGIQGPIGPNGISSYTHIAYATGPTGQGFSTAHFASATYIGMYVDSTATDSTSYIAYKWSLIKGLDGAQGIQGPTGPNGLASYFHTAWATNATGTTGFSTTDSVGKSYLGTYSDNTPADSNSPGSYTWTLIKGETGDPGRSITSVNVWYYLSTSATSLAGGSWVDTAPAWVSGKYMWSKAITTYSSGSPTESGAACITGAQGTTGNTGATGKGVTSITEEYAISTSKTVAPTTFSATRPTWTAGNYIWTRSKIVYNNPTSTDYTAAIPSTEWEAVNVIEPRVDTLEEVTTASAITTTFITEFGKTDSRQITKGIIRLDQNGINVAKSASDVNTQLASDGLTIRDGETPLAVFGEAGAVIPHADIEVLSSPNVIQMRPSVTVNVGSGYTFTSINDALNWIFPAGTKIIDGFAQINVKSNIAEDVTISNIHGGKVVLDIAGRTLTGKIKVENCTARVEILGSSSAYGTIKANNQPIFAENSRNVYANYLNINGDSGSYGILADYGSLVHVTACDFVNSSFAVLASGDAFIIVRDCKGSPLYTGRAQYGGVLMFTGSVPKGTTGYVAIVKGFLTEQGAIAQVASAYSPPAVTSQTFVQTFTSATFDTLVHGTTNVDSYYGPVATQNRWDSSMGWKDGRIRLSSAIYSFFNGGTNISIRVRLKRKDSTHGSSGAVYPAPYNHSASFSSGALRGGWTGWAAISSAYFGSGGATLTYYNGVTGSSGYAIWDAIEVEVTVTKQV